MLLAVEVVAVVVEVGVEEEVVLKDAARKKTFLASFLLLYCEALSWGKV